MPACTATLDLCSAPVLAHPVGVYLHLNQAPVVELIGDRRRDVPERNEHLRDEPLRVRAAPLVEHPVVPGAHEREREARVLRFEELRAAEARERGEQQLRTHPVLVHRLDALVHVVDGGDHVFVAPRVEIVAASRLACSEDPGPCVPLEGQRVEAVLPEPSLDAVTVDDAGRAIAKARLDVVDEHMGRLDDVVIDRYRLHVITQHGALRSSSHHVTPY